MKSALVDTNTLSLFFRNQPLVVENFNAYIKKSGKIKISIIYPQSPQGGTKE
ncbi:MAG: hypothetical protein PUP92_25530 [Rhizonema sp. PD38]|nr:hypothetical protein [Rhizonema sp. PD38]